MKLLPFAVGLVLVTAMDLHPFWYAILAVTWLIDVYFAEMDRT